MKKFFIVGLFLVNLFSTLQLQAMHRSGFLRKVCKPTGLALGASGAWNWHPHPAQPQQGRVVAADHGAVRNHDANLIQCSAHFSGEQKYPLCFVLVSKEGRAFFNQILEQVSISQLDNKLLFFTQNTEQADQVRGNLNQFKKQDLIGLWEEIDLEEGASCFVVAIVKNKTMMTRVGYVYNRIAWLVGTMVIGTVGAGGSMAFYYMKYPI